MELWNNEFPGKFVHMDHCNQAKLLTEMINHIPPPCMKLRERWYPQRWMDPMLQLIELIQRPSSPGPQPVDYIPTVINRGVRCVMLRSRLERYSLRFCCTRTIQRNMYEKVCTSAVLRQRECQIQFCQTHSMGLYEEEESVYNLIPRTQIVPERPTRHTSSVSPVVS